MRSGWKKAPQPGYYNWRGWTVLRVRQGMVFAYRVSGSVEACYGPFNTLNAAMDYVMAAGKTPVLQLRPR